MNKMILRKAFDLPSKQEDYDKIIKCIKFLRLFYPSLIFEEEGSYCTIYSNHLDDIDNFVIALTKLIIYPVDEKIILNIQSQSYNFSVTCQLNDDLTNILKQYLR